MNESFILNEIKKLILDKAGIKTITPADCKIISIEISKTLNKNVSETTIKRLFGFAVAKHNFSKFTLTTLTEYVDEKYLAMSVANMTFPTSGVLRNWKDIKEKARGVTNFTIKTIMNRSGLPFEMTIGRHFAEQDFELFYKSNFSFLSFMSQPGYGKSILLTHLASKLINDELPYFCNSTLLFIKINNLFQHNSNTLNFEEQLKIHLGIHARESLIHYANRNYEATGGKLVIFLDGFSNTDLIRNVKKLLFESIVNFICEVEDSKAIKLVMNMRSTTWTRFYNEIRHSAFLKAKWFPGSYFSLNEMSNVPPLTETEIDKILIKIPYLKNDIISSKLKSQLKFPFHIQLFYQLKKENNEFRYLSNITIHELICMFINNKIYKSNYYTEKILFLKKIIQISDYGKKGNAVPKDALMKELLTFKNAYMELLSDGILMEELSHDSFHPREYVRFIHPHVFEYFLFVELQEKFDSRSGESLSSYICKTYECKDVRYLLLQWSARHSVKVGDFTSLAEIFKMSLNNYERNYLVVFTVENIHYRFRNHPDLSKSEEALEFHKVIIWELIKSDILDSFCRETLEMLIEITVDEETLMVYHTLLSKLDILNLDANKIEKRSALLSKYNYENWPVNPYQFARFIYAKITETEFNEAVFFEEIKQQLPAQRQKEISPQLVISFTLISLLNYFNDHVPQSTEILSLMACNTSGLLMRRSTFSIAVISKLLFSISLSEPERKTRQALNVLNLIEIKKQQPELTKYEETLMRLTRANYLLLMGNYEEAISHCRECLHIFRRNQFNLICVFTYNLLIRIFKNMNENSRVQESKYEMLSFLEENNLSGKFYHLTNQIDSF